MLSCCLLTLCYDFPEWQTLYWSLRLQHCLAYNITKIILHEWESPWPHATTTALQATWGRFPSAIVHIQMPCQCSLTWSSAYEVIFPKSLCRPWVISKVPVSPSFSSPTHSHVSSFSALALKLMTNEFCNTSRKLPQHSNNFLGQFTFFNVWRRLRGWGISSFLIPWTTGKPFWPIYMDRRWCHSTVKALAALALPSWLTTDSDFSSLGSLSKTNISDH